MNSLPFPLSITKEEINAFPVERFEGKIEIISSIEAVKPVVKRLWQEKILGFDTETRPSFKKGVSHKVCLLQIATRKTVYLFRLNHIGFPQELKSILESPSVCKTGVALHDDIKALKEFGEFNADGFIEIAKIAKLLEIKNSGLRSLAGIVFRVRISKGARLSNWENEILSPAQISYAATDAWISLKLYLYFLENGFLPPNLLNEISVG